MTEPLAFGTPGSALVVLCHDWYGRLPWISDYADALADRGYRALAVDFFNGATTTDDDVADEQTQSISRDDAFEVIVSAIEQGRAEGSEKVALVGFSYGAWRSLAVAQEGVADAVVSYYATLGTEEHTQLSVPVLLHVAEHDEFYDAPGSAPDEFVARAAKQGTSVTRYDYPGTSHGFADASVARNYDADAAKLAFARTATFLDEFLVGD